MSPHITLNRRHLLLGTAAALMTGSIPPAVPAEVDAESALPAGIAGGWQIHTLAFSVTDHRYLTATTRIEWTDEGVVLTLTEGAPGSVSDEPSAPPFFRATLPDALGLELLETMSHHSDARWEAHQETWLQDPWENCPACNRCYASSCSHCHGAGRFKLDPERAAARVEAERAWRRSPR